MGSKAGTDKLHEKMKQELGEEGRILELKRRASIGGSKKSEAKRIAAKLREAKKRAERGSSK